MVCTSQALWTRPTLGRFVFYKLLTLIPVSVAIIGIGRHASSPAWVGVYVGLCLLHAGIMNAIKCPHCPYYHRGERTFRCFIWWNMPRLFRPRTGPESRVVGIYAPVGMLALTAFPTIWLWREWELLFVFLLSIVVLLLSIGMNECTRCLNFACGHNEVPEEVRQEFAREQEEEPVGV